MFPRESQSSQVQSSLVASTRQSSEVVSRTMRCLGRQRFQIIQQSTIHRRAIRSMNLKTWPLSPNRTVPPHLHPSYLVVTPKEYHFLQSASRTHLLPLSTYFLSILYQTKSRQAPNMSHSLLSRSTDTDVHHREAMLQNGLGLYRCSTRMACWLITV